MERLIACGLRRYTPAAQSGTTVTYLRTNHSANGHTNNGANRYTYGSANRNANSTSDEYPSSNGSDIFRVG